MSGHWGAVLTAMVTPFDDDLRLDLDAAVDVAKYLQEHGNDGLVVAGTTGEAPTLTDDEKVDLWRAVTEAVTIPVVAGSGSNDTAHTIELTARASQVGVAGILLVGPYYNRPSQAGIDSHFRAATAATDLPVMIYDVPGRTGRRVAHDTFVRLVRDVPNVVALKDATGDPAAAAKLNAELGDGLDIYSGDDSLTLPLLAVGACGVVGVATHWCGVEFGEMITAFDKGDVGLARQINARLIDSYAYENSDTCVFSQAAKAMMRTLGLRVGECRLPLGPAPSGTEARAREVYAALHA